MRKLFFCLIPIIALVSAFPALAQWRPLETIPESRQRHAAENYQTYESNHYSAPLGGYPERLGDPAPLGTPQPGFATPGAPAPTSSYPGPAHPRRFGP